MWFLAEVVGKVLVEAVNAVERVIDSSKNDIGLLSQEDLAELADELDDHSGLLGMYSGRTFVPRLIEAVGQEKSWRPGILLLFESGRGAVLSEFLDEEFEYEKQWAPGSATDVHNDPTPLLVGKGGIPVASFRSDLIPAGFEPLERSETALFFENLGNDYDGDGSNTWVSGASHSLSAIYVGSICDTGLKKLRQRCSGRKSW